MRSFTHIILLGGILLSVLSCGKQYDVCIYGGTSAGVVAARSAALEGYSVVIVEPSGHIGGLTTGGLGLTDIGNKQVVQGLSRQFYRELGKHYGKLESWVFEPHVAQEVMNAYLEHPRITVLRRTGMDRLSKRGTHINGMHTNLLDEEGSVLDRGPKIRAKVFIDASYEGDLLPASGVSYAVGREASALYGESWNGRHIATNHQFPDGVDPYVVPGDPASGLLPGVTEGPAGEEGEGDPGILNAESIGQNCEQDCQNDENDGNNLVLLFEVCHCALTHILCDFLHCHGTLALLHHLTEEDPGEQKRQDRGCRNRIKQSVHKLCCLV